jgi:hypothetical protein
MLRAKLFIILFLFIPVFIWSLSNDDPGKNEKRKKNIITTCSVGRITKLLVDGSRKEKLVPEIKNRKVMISIFYPATESVNNHKSPVYLDLFSPAKGKALEMLKKLGIDETIIKNFKTGVYNNAPLAKSNDTFPLIIYSPGFGVDRDMALYLFKPLVKAGYIVITVGHTYDSFFTVFPGGDIAEQTRLHYDLKENDHTFWPLLMEIRKKDISFVLKELSRINKTDKVFKKKLDMKKIGVMGHSIGGASIFDLANEDEQIKAGIVLDGLLDYSIAVKRREQKRKTNTPFLFFRSNATTYKPIRSNLARVFKGRENQDFEKGEKGIDEMANEMYASQSIMLNMLAGYYKFLKLKGSKHNTFNDLPLLFSKPGALHGGVPIVKAHHIISSICRSFFNEFLLQRKKAFTVQLKNKSELSGLCLLKKSGEIKECF